MCLFISVCYLYAQKYIALDGNDANPGTREHPFGTFQKAISESVPGSVRLRAKRTAASRFDARCKTTRSGGGLLNLFVGYLTQ